MTSKRNSAKNEADLTTKKEKTKKNAKKKRQNRTEI